MADPKRNDTAISMEEFNATAAASLGAEPTEQAEVDLDTIDAPEPARGEVVLGTLLPEEAKMFVQLLQASEQCELLEAECTAAELTTVAEVVRRNGGKAMDEHRMNALKAEVESTRLVERALKMEQMFMVMRRRDYLSSHLFYSICQRLGHADYTVAIRSKGRIVAARRKW